MNYIFARFRLLPALCLIAVAIIASGCAHYGDGYGYHGSRYSPHSSTRGNFKGKTLNSFDCPLLYRFSWTLLSPMSIKGRVDRTST